MIFYTLLVILAIQRMMELFIAKRNEKWMKKQGAIEVGQTHYKWIVIVHMCFFLSLFIEVQWFQKVVSNWWVWLTLLFVIVQAARVWAISSLGKYWNTKIIILPEADVVLKGPYKFIKHPNYVIVAIEFIVIPLLFHAHITMILFSVLNVAILSVRIPSEEKALKLFTNYETSTQQHRRFIPIKKP
ncbi:isoprenylcysteine carboxylmethyltransferase family protein [Bacillus sp. CGMCC 1.16541]|uniref:isoprenylcysteine carboxyl methyltransferase family protein n=1 Tax=Bacillus sp. CGMCC 1.16541 TaxID=2185143 RepID=UPI000D731E78|nr:isoprenylcysteine carboxylmethyltransferase family protein [Bacillus sp. CGMCC 1.16541]